MLFRSVTKTNLKSISKIRSKSASKISTKKKYSTDVTKDDFLEETLQYDDITNMELDDLVGKKEKYEEMKQISFDHTQSIAEIQRMHSHVEPEMFKYVQEEDRLKFTGKEIADAKNFFSGKLTWRPVHTEEEIEASGLPEICFIGRSNVGKSSLLNSLVGFKVVKVGKTPGKTKMLHYIEVAQRVCVVDLPGFGFAKVSREDKKRMSALLDSYVGHRESLDIQRVICFLVDIRHQLRREEHLLMNQLDELHTIYIVVLTKADKIPFHDANRIARSIEKSLSHHPKCFPEVFITSSINPASLDRLKACLHRLCEQTD